MEMLKQRFELWTKGCIRSFRNGVATFASVLSSTGRFLSIYSLRKWVFRISTQPAILRSKSHSRQAHCHLDADRKEYI